MTKVKGSKINLYIIVKSVDGGTGTFILNFLKIKKIFSSRSLRIKILVLEKPAYRKIGGDSFHFLRRTNFYPQKYSFAPKNFVYFINELLWIKNILPRKGLTILLSIDLRSNLLAIISKVISLNRIKVIATTHINLAALTLARANVISASFLKLIIKYFYPKADTLVGVSKTLSQSLRRDFGISKRLVTIYDGQNTRQTEPKRFSRQDSKIILSIGRFSVQKDHGNLLKAFRLVVNKMPNIKLWLAGDGPEKKRVVSHIKKLNLGKHVKLLGWRKNVYPLLKKSDVFVLSSKSEGFGYVLVEAMSRGIPVVSTDTPYGPSEILQRGRYGILVPMGNPVLLKEAILRLLSSKKNYEYYARMSIERSRFFSLEKMLAGYKKAILSLSR